MKDQGYEVKKLSGVKEFTVEVPGSKSITNRALLLAALGEGECLLRGVLFSEDSRAFLSCLAALGFRMSVNEKAKTVKIAGTGGMIPRRRAEIDVCSAGTAARFLTVMLAFAGGEYTLRASAQMEKRPMRPLLDELKRGGVKIEYLKAEGFFPFVLHSDGMNTEKFAIDTDVSSQFASALLMSAVLLKKDARIRLTGGRTAGAYIGITLSVMKDFGVNVEKDGNDYVVPAGQKYRLAEYAIEPDFSAACYFFAAGALLNVKAKVRGVSLGSMQGDKKFLTVLEEMGCKVREGPDGVALIGTDAPGGVEVNMNDFSDQALTLAAIAPFAASPVTISGIGHIRKQECDRIRAMRENLERMGVKVEEYEDGIKIFPCEKILPAEIETFHDHRVAMAFAIAGLKYGGIRIKDPTCCKKTFENFFEVLNTLYSAKGATE